MLLAAFDPLVIAQIITALGTLLTATALVITAWKGSKKVEEVRTTLEGSTNNVDGKLDNITHLVNGHTEALRSEIQELHTALRTADQEIADSKDNDRSRGN